MNHREQIRDFCRDGNEIKAISLLEEICNNSPLNLELKIDLALLLLNTSVYADSHIFALQLLDEILKKSDVNLKALILKSYIEDFYIGDIENSTLDNIKRHIKRLDVSCQHYNLLFLVKAFYYREKNSDKYYTSILDYTVKDADCSLPYYTVAKYYKSLNKITECKKSLEKALENVTYVFDDTVGIDPINFDEFVNCILRGTHLPQTHYDWMLIEFRKL